MLPQQAAMSPAGVAGVSSHVTSPIRALSIRREGCDVRPLPKSISFEGCGAAISYHMGVIQALYQTYGQEEIAKSSLKIMGTSSGSIAALILALGLDAEQWLHKMFDAWAPMGYCLQADGYVGKVLSQMLNEVGPDAHKRLNGRLFISITKFFSRNVKVSEWQSNSEVKRIVLASCFIPLTMLRPIWIGQSFAVDGGFSDNFPRLDGKDTVLVSPSRSPDAEIKPELKVRFRDLIGAPKRPRFFELWDTGMENGLDYFQPNTQHNLNITHEPVAKQTACGKCYFWAMKQPCCNATRLFLFWIILFIQVLCLPLCCVLWCRIYIDDLAQTACARPPATLSAAADGGAAKKEEDSAANGLPPAPVVEAGATRV